MFQPSLVLPTVETLNGPNGSTNQIEIHKYIYINIYIKHTCRRIKVVI